MKGIQGAWLTASLMMAAASPAWAINKCTGPDGAVVFQDAPCSLTTKSEEVKAYAGKGSPGLNSKGATLCETHWRSEPDWKDPDSVRITNIRRSGFTTIKLHDASIIAVAYIADVNAKNSYGGYTGRKPAICYLDQSETRVLDVVTLSR